MRTCPLGLFVVAAVLQAAPVRGQLLEAGGTIATACRGIEGKSLCGKISYFRWYMKRGCTEIEKEDRRKPGTHGTLTRLWNLLKCADCRLRADRQRVCLGCAAHD